MEEETATRSSSCSTRSTQSSRGSNQSREVHRGRGGGRAAPLHLTLRTCSFGYTNPQGTGFLAVAPHWRLRQRTPLTRLPSRGSCQPRTRGGPGPLRFAAPLLSWLHHISGSSKWARRARFL